MRFKDIVHCYVEDIVPAPKDVAALRKSFRDNGFREKEISDNKWLYKRGSPVALEFDYSSEAIEVQVILELFGEHMSINIGNWGFPFEPLLMKPRFRRQLVTIVEQVNSNGVLQCDPQKINEIKMLSNYKSSAAKWALLVTAAGAVLLAIVKNT